jgi:tape measure domain-containing protein
MSADLGTAYVQILPSTKGLGRSLISQMDGPAEAAGRSAGSRLGSAVATAAKVGIMAAGAAVVASAGLILKKGFDRALDLEDARATLGALGYEAKQVQSITDDVLASVKNTPFALNEAMSAAVSALAAGVPEGEGLTSYLKAIGDAATVAKVPFNDMAAIFNKVTGIGKVTGEVLNQMGERGIPILQWLADEYGVSTEALRDMVSKGEVDSAAFQRAIENNVGGAALAAGETTRGAWANMMAAIGRLGAGVVEGFLPQIRGGLEGMIGIIDSLAPHAQRIGQFLGDAFQNVLDVFQGFVGWLKEGVNPIKAVGLALAENFGDSIITDAIIGLGEMVGNLVSTFQNMRTSGSGLFDTIKAQVGPLMASFSNLLALVIPFAKTFYNDTIKPMVANVSAAFGELAAEVLPTVKAIIDFIVKNWPAIRAATEPVIRGVVQIVGGLLRILAGIIRTVMAVIRGDWSAAWEGIKTVARGFVDVLKGLFNSSTLIQTGKNLIMGLWNGLKSMDGWIRNKIRGWVGNVVSFIKGLFGIESPSKLFRDEIGANLALGIGEGFDREMSGITENIDATVAGIGAVTVDAAPAPASGGMVINVDARGATDPTGVRDAAERGVDAALSRHVGTARLKASMMGA